MQGATTLLVMQITWDARLIKLVTSITSNSLGRVSTLDRSVHIPQRVVTSFCLSAIEAFSSRIVTGIPFDTLTACIGDGVWGDCLADKRVIAGAPVGMPR